MTIRKTTESDIVSACLCLLALHRIPAWRQNTGAARLGDRFVRFGTPGAPDIVGILPGSGRFLAVECKTATGRIRPTQRAYLDAVTAAGGLALIVRSALDLDAALRAEGIIP